MVGKEVNHEKTYPYAGYEVLLANLKYYGWYLKAHRIKDAPL